VNVPNWKGNTLNTQAGALAGTSMRYHELALQQWLNTVFKLRWGVPVPVVFSTPMDAFSAFNKLWAENDNVFKYLLDVKDEEGRPVYQPYPQPVRYPIISVYRKGWKLRQSHNFSIHRMRYINWPTVSSTGSSVYGRPDQGDNLTQCNMGHVTTSRFPMAFDYRFQIDHFCNRPDTQAFYISQLFREFWRTGGPTMQTWIVVNYPGLGSKLVRLYVDGEIQNMTPEEPEDGKSVEFRTSFTVVLEGYDIDLDYQIYPTLWKLVLRSGSVDPAALTDAFNALTIDMREQPDNSVVNYRSKMGAMPPEGDCPQKLRDARLEREQVQVTVLEALQVTTQGPSGYPPAAGVTAFGTASLASV
jgi:hypothetical protein